MRVLVTGGAGFIGSHVVDGLLAAGHQVAVIDCLHPAAHGATPDYCDPRADYCWVDLRDQAAVAAAVEGVDAVSHQAAMVGLGVDFDDAPGYVAANDLGTAVLLRALHHTRFAGRLVLGSSMAVYGDGLYRCAEHGVVRAGPRSVADLQAGRFDPPCPACGQPLVAQPISEDAAADPRSVYAATKLHQEHLCLAYGREHDLPVTVLRYHNVYGPRMPRDTPYAGVASVFRSALERGQAPRVLEDGGQLRDFVHVDEVAAANLLGLTGPTPRPGVFNIASGQPQTVLRLAVALAQALDGPPPRVTGGFRAGDVRHVCASPTRAREALGFTAKMGFADGIRQFATAPLRAPAATRRPSPAALLLADRHRSCGGQPSS